MKSDGSVIRLAAYVVGEAAGLDDMETVVLRRGAECVRIMALNAVRETDRMRGVVGAVRGFISQCGPCPMVDADKDECPEVECAYCLVVRLMKSQVLSPRESP